jgi:hypothetical protein
MATLSFGPVEVGLHHDSFYLPVPGTGGTISLRDPDAGPAPDRLKKILCDGEKVSASELYVLLPGLLDAQWKPAGFGLDGIKREWTTVLDDIRVNLVAVQPANQDAANQVLQQLVETLNEALQLARDVLTGYWRVTAGDHHFTAFIRADNSWWVSEALPADGSRRVSKFVAYGIDANPEAALQAWAATQGQPVRLEKR